MNNIQQKIIDNYWLKKVKNSHVFDRLSSKKEVKKYFINNEDILFFSQITNSNELAEYTVLLCVFNALLCRYFDLDRFIYSSNSGLEEIPLLLKFNSIKEKTFKTYLQEIKEEVQKVYQYSNYEDKIQKKYLFEKYANYGFLYSSKQVDFDSPIPFTLSLKKAENGVEVEVIYNDSFIGQKIVQHFLETFKCWIINLESYLDEPVKNLPIVSQAESRQLLETFNSTNADYPKDKTIIHLFEEQAAKTPDSTAVVFEDLKLTYDQLNEKSNQLASCLCSKHNIQPDDLIAIKLDRGENILIAILGVLKSGGAYVPIDTNYPNQRIEYIQRDCNAKVVIDQSFLDEFEKTKAKYSKENIDNIISSKNLAYVIYTSGTTGKPKGVEICHSNALSLIHWSQQEFNSDKFDIAYASTSYCFDLSIYEMFYPLSIGKKIRILNDALEIGQNLKEDKKVLINTVPSSIRSLMENGGALENVSIINLAGEPFPVDIANQLTQSNIEIRNLYGPSEDTTYSTIYKLDAKKEYAKTVPIGKPIFNTQVYILDDNLELLPIGLTGKLYISGAGLAKGYLNRPELTAEKFIDNPFEEGQRMYDTGDLAKWLPDGNLEFLGRKDHQVKLRGYRIELGEIENTILSYTEDIKQVVVLATNNTLVAYYTENNSIDKAALKGYLKEKLPIYMIPNHFEVLQSIPLTPNGKIDRKALNNIDINYKVSSNYVAPRNKTEQTLVEIWQEVLSVEKIGIQDNFFELGGHSLMIGQVINQIYKKLNGSISYKSFFYEPLIESISKAIQKTNYIPIPKAPEQACYPLTSSQHRIWVLSQLEGGDIAYNMPGVVVLKGILDIDKFKKAFDLLIEKHEILRTSFKLNEEGIVYQHINEKDELNLDIAYFDFKDKTKEAIDEYIRNEQAKPFDLAQAPLLRASLLSVGEKEHLFSFVMHHIVGDGWSMEILISEVIATYNALLKNEAFTSKKLSIQYKDYSVWLKSQINEKSYKASEDFWLKKFEGELPVLELPSFKKRPLVQTYYGKTVKHHFSSAFLSKIKEFSKAQDATLFMTLLAGINALLYRYTNQEDLIVGTPMAGREHPDLEHQIGLYLNTLAIRTQLNNEFSFLDLLQHQKETLLEAYQHQQYPFDELVSKLNLKRDTSRSALFDVMVVLQNQNQVHSISSNTLELEGIEIEAYDLERNTSQFDASFTFVENEKALELEIEYNTDIYDEFLMVRIFEHFEHLLNQAIDYPNEHLLTINYLAAEQSKQILETFNNTKVDYPKDKTVVDLFEEQVVKTPNNTAVVFDNLKLTYKQLNEQSNQLASCLRKKYNIQPDDLFAIKLDRSENLLVAIFGILKSGAAYVPIDTNYPKQRIEYIEKDSNAKAIIDQYFLDEFEKTKAQYSKENIEHIALPDNLAYVIYTSGTTGKPKGVMVKHDNILNQILWYVDNFKVDSSTNSILLTSHTFDPSIQDIFGTFSMGGKLHLVKSDEVKDIAFLQRYIKLHQISILNYVPNFIDELLSNIDKIDSIQAIIVGGEPLLPQVKDRLLQKGYKLYNNYGPTETTVDILSGLMGKQKVHIGKPIANTRAYVLDEYYNLQPIGVSGKLMISGSGVSKGYLNEDQLTAKKFTENPYEPFQKMYDTGDLARWLPDGNIEFLGRNDHQVKIRGYRIELGEIECALNEFSEDIKQTVVTVKEIEKEKTLIAYYVTSNPKQKAELKDFLSDKLPAYMVPNFFVELEAIPLTPNGKIDRNKLPGISGRDAIKKQYVAPKNETEEKLVSIWKEILGLESIGTKDDFFELGGHSLKITKLKNHIAKAFNADLSFNDLFLKTTVDEQAKLILKTSPKEYQLIPQAPIQDFYPLSSSQQRIWVLCQFEGSSAAYNMPGIYAIVGAIKKEALQKAFETLIERHEVLRTRFIQDVSGEVKQQVLSKTENNFKLKLIELSTEENEEQLIKKETNHVFDFENESLLRASLLKTIKNQSILIVVVHHIIGDGWSIDLLTNELFNLYNTFIKRKESVLQPLSIQYKDFAIWEQKQLSNPKENKAKAYWVQQFSDEIPVLELPYKDKRPLHKTYNGNIKKLSISNELVSKLKLLCQENDSTLFMGLLTIVKVLLYRYTNQKDIIVGSPVVGRQHIQLQDQIGVYINTLALRTKFDGQNSFSEVLKKVKETTTNAYTYQSYPFDRLVEDLDLPRNLNRNPLFDIMVTLQNTDQEHKRLNFIEDLVIGEIKVTNDISCKFDLDFVFEEIDNNINLSLIYNTSLFSSKFINDFCEQFYMLINETIDKPELPIYKLQVLTNLQKDELLRCGTYYQNLSLNSNKTFLDYFNDWVIKTPDALAIQDDQNELTYDELDRKSDSIANYINKSIAEEEQVIGVVLDRSVNTIAVLLGILKSRRAYIPLDPTFPMERLQYIVSHSKASTIICDDKFSFFDSNEVTLLTTEKILNESNNNKSDTKVESFPNSDKTAYIIYTSGSTGHPKGVEIGHQSLMNFLMSMKEEPGIRPKDVLYAVTTYSFDISILEFFAPLIAGASVFIANNNTLSDAQKIIEEIETIQPSIIQATPSFYQLLFNAGWKGNKNMKALCGGDALSEALATQLLSSCKELWNMYGPTETTIWSSIKQIKKANEAANIGKPIANTSMFVIGENKELLPNGARGMLYIGGEGLAKGYYKDENLTREKFIRNPYGDGLLYETGDLVNWNKDNELTFFGRNDHQVKVRGYRIELGDIETKLNLIESLDKAIVITKKDAINEAVLVAYYTSKQQVKNSVLKKQLKKSLPDYMIPSQFIPVDSFPLTPNKKIDRKALSKINIEYNVKKKYIAPSTKVEKKLLTLWKEIFELEKISVDDNFFDLGGHSLTATKLVSKIQEEFSIKLSINKIFEYISIEDQALFIENIQLINQPKKVDLETEFESIKI